VSELEPMDDDKDKEPLHPSKLYATSTSFWTISRAISSSIPPHTRRVTRSFKCPCGLDAAWCLQSMLICPIHDSSIHVFTSSGSRQTRSSLTPMSVGFGFNSHHHLGHTPTLRGVRSSARVTFPPPPPPPPPARWRTGGGACPLPPPPPFSGGGLFDVGVSLRFLLSGSISVEGIDLAYGKGPRSS